MCLILGNLIFSIFRGPIELALGITVGSIAGVMCWFFPDKNQVTNFIVSIPIQEENKKTGGNLRVLAGIYEFYKSYF